MTAPRRKPIFANLALAGALLSPALYVLSYAPAFRLAGDAGDDDYFGLREDWQELYRPVEWLTDNTPLRETLLNWASLWGDYVERDFRLRSDFRTRGFDPYPDGWLIYRIPLGTDLDIPLRPAPYPTSDPDL